MNIYGIQTEVIHLGDDLAEVFLGSLANPIAEKSIIIVTSKVIAVAQGRVRSFASDAEFSELVHLEADEVLGKAEHYNIWLTRKNGLLMPNAGIDKSNSQLGTAILLPENCQQFADEFRAQLQQKSSVQELGVIVADSTVVSFRLGIVGRAVAWSGFVGVSDERGKADLFGNRLTVSRIAVADNLASVAQNFFGQAAEQTPFVVCENTPVTYTDEQQDSRVAQIAPEDDLYASLWRTTSGKF